MSMQQQQEEEHETNMTTDTESVTANIQQLGDQDENNGTPHLEESPEEEVPVNLEHVNVDDDYVSNPPETQTEPLGEENVTNMEMNGNDIYVHTCIYVNILTHTLMYIQMLVLKKVIMNKLKRWRKWGMMKLLSWTYNIPML